VTALIETLQRSRGCRSSLLNHGPVSALAAGVGPQLGADDLVAEPHVGLVPQLLRQRRHHRAHRARSADVELGDRLANLGLDLLARQHLDLGESLDDGELGLLMRDEVGAVPLLELGDGVSMPLRDPNHHGIDLVRRQSMLKLDLLVLQCGSNHADSIATDLVAGPHRVLQLVCQLLLDIRRHTPVPSRPCAEHRIANLRGPVPLGGVPIRSDRVYTRPGRFGCISGKPRTGGCPYGWMYGKHHIVSGADTDYYLVTVDVFSRLSPAYWWTDPGTTIEGPIAIGFAAVLGVTFVLGIAAWILAPRLGLENRIVQRFVVRIAKWTVGLSAAGLLLLLFRWQIVPFFSKRLWLFVWVATVVGMAGYAGYWWRKVYPQRMMAWEESERIRRYLPRPGQGGGRSRRRSRRRR
jgi:hypothetical protein